MSRFSYLVGRFSGVHLWPVLGVPRGNSVRIFTRSVEPSWLAVAQQARRLILTEEMQLRLAASALHLAVPQRHLSNEGLNQLELCYAELVFSELGLARRIKCSSVFSQ